jgi:hypothetical protein
MGANQLENPAVNELSTEVEFARKRIPNCKKTWPMKSQEIARLVAEAHRINTELSEFLIAGRDAHRDLGPLDLLVMKLGHNVYGSESQWRAFTKLKNRPVGIRENVDVTSLYDALAASFEFLRIQIEQFGVCPRTKSDLLVLSLLQSPVTTSYRLAITASCSKATASRWLGSLQGAGVARRISLSRTNHYVILPVARAVFAQLTEDPASPDAKARAEDASLAKLRLRTNTGFHPYKRPVPWNRSYREVPIVFDKWMQL